MFHPGAPGSVPGDCTVATFIWYKNYIGDVIIRRKLVALINEQFIVYIRHIFAISMIFGIV
jgi:hypothetical protein